LETNAILKEVTELQEGADRRAALLEQQYGAMALASKKKLDVCNTGFSTATLIPTMYHQRNFVEMCEWQPLDGGLSVVQQIANGGDENAIMREAYAKYFGRGPFMSDPIGIQVQYSNINHLQPLHRMTRGGTMRCRQ
jgi:hypothetical protein